MRLSAISFSAEMINISKGANLDVDMRNCFFLSRYRWRNDDAIFWRFHAKWVANKIRNK